MHMGEPIETTKSRLRRELGARRRGATPVSIARASTAACARLVGSALFASARRIAVYAGRAGELDPRAIADAAIERGLPVYYPRVEDGSLAFRLARPSELIRGAFGIPEPPASAPVLLAEDAHVLFVIPGLGFDRQGNRLGTGHGFFDRALTRHPSATRVGMGWASAVVPWLPTHPGDVPMHAILTEDELFTVDRHVGVSQGDLP